MTKNQDRRILLRLRCIYEAIKMKPGITSSNLALELGWPKHRVYNALPTMESAGLFLYEGDRGQLYVFGIGDPCPISNEPRNMFKPERKTDASK